MFTSPAIERSSKSLLPTIASTWPVAGSITTIAVLLACARRLTSSFWPTIRSASRWVARSMVVWMVSPPVNSSSGPKRARTRSWM